MVYGARFLHGGWGPGGSEAMAQPTNAILLAAGHPWDDRFQYSDFCGGCLAEVVVMAAAFELAPPALVVWRALGLVVSLGVVALCWAIANRAAGRGAAVAAASLVVFAPDLYRYNTRETYGNHFEVQIFVFAAFLAWGALLRKPNALRAFWLGLLLGLGCWFAYTSLLAVPALRGLWLVVDAKAWRSRRLVAAAAGMLVGFLPWLVPRLLGAFGGLAAPTVYGQGPVEILSKGLQGLPELFGVVLGQTYWRALFGPSLGDVSGVAGFVYMVLQAGAVLACVVVGVGRLRRGEHRGPEPQPPWELAIAGAMLTLGVGYALAAPAMQGWPPTWPLPPDVFRYLIASVPLTALAVAVLHARFETSEDQRIRRGAWVGLGVMLLMGVGSTIGFGAGLQLGLRPLFLGAWNGGQDVLYADSTKGVEPARLLAAPASPAELFDAEGHPAAVRMFQRHLGALSADWYLAPEEWDDLAHWLEGLSSIDRRDFFSGTGVALLRRGIVSQDFVPCSLNDDPLEAVLSEAAVLELLVERGRVAGNWMNQQARDRVAGQPGILDPTRAEDRCAVWLAGEWRAHQEVNDRNFSRLDPLVVTGRGMAFGASLAPGLRPYFVRGLGRELGRVWGYDRAACSAILDSVPKSLRSDLRRGLIAGAEDAFVWHRVPG